HGARPGAASRIDRRAARPPHPLRLAAAGGAELHGRRAVQAGARESRVDRPHRQRAVDRVRADRPRARDPLMSERSDIEVILFDLGGVLIELAGVEKMIEWSPGIETVEELWRRWLHSDAVRRFETGAIGRD